MRLAVKRRLTTLAAVVSLVLCVATVALWVRSYWRYDGYADYSVGIDLTSVSGRLLFIRVRGLRQTGEETHGFWSESSSSPRGGFVASLFDARPLDSFANRAGFGYVNRPVAESVPGLFALSVPHWFVILLTAIAPIMWLHHRRRMRLIAHRHATQRCPTCGYDLRATPARCPECGAVPAAAAAR